MADRVLVVCEGRITADIARAEATPEAVMPAATRTAEVADDATTRDARGRPRPSALARRARAGSRRGRRALDHRARAPASCRSSLVLLLVIAVATIKTPELPVQLRTAGATCCSTPSILLLLAVGQAVVIITRNVDLSVGSVLGLTAYLTGRLFIDHPGIPIVAVVRGRPAGRRGARPGQRPAGRVRQGAGAGDHARHALHLPRHRPHLGRQQPDQRLRHARRLPATLGTAADPGDPGADDHRGSSCWSSSATTCTPPAAAASSTRSAPTRTPPCSTASRVTPPRARRVRALRRARRPGRRRLRRPLRHASAPAPAPASSSRRSAAVVIGGVAIFGGSGTVWGAAIGAVPARHHQPRAADPRHPGLLAARRRRRPDPRRRSCLDRVLALRAGPPAHRSEGRVMTTADRRHAARDVRRRTRARSWQRLLLTREAAVIALLVAGLRLRARSTCRSSTAR